MRFGHVMLWLATVCTLSVGAGALFLVTPPAAQGKELASAPTAQGVADKKVHRLVLQCLRCGKSGCCSRPSPA